jgi:hypothetical protein
LTRIGDHGVQSNLPSAWIGDHAGFEQFQRARNKSLTSNEILLESHLKPSVKVLNTLHRAMDSVIADPAVVSVGGICVRVAATRVGFEYMGSIQFHVGRDVAIQPGEDMLSKMVQPVEEGGYAVTVVEPAEAGTPALGLNFPRARLGMLFLPLRFDGAEVIREVEPKDFAKVIRERYGVAMKDPLFR